MLILRKGTLATILVGREVVCLFHECYFYVKELTNYVQTKLSNWSASVKNEPIDPVTSKNKSIWC